MSTGSDSPASDNSDACSALLAAMEQLVDEVGARSVSLRAVARRAGLSHSAPGHCFGDLDGMFAAFAREGFAGLDATLGDAAKKGGGPEEQVLSVCRAYVHFALANSAQFDVMFRIGLNKSAHPELQAKAGEAFRRLADPVEAWCSQQAGAVRANAVTLQIWALAHGLANFAVDGQLETFFPGRDIDDLVAETVRLAGAS